MSYGEVFFTENDQYRVSVKKRDFIGLSVELDSAAPTFELTYNGESESIFAPTMPASIRVYFIVNNQSELDLIEDIFGAGDQDYQIVLYKNGVIKFIGFALPDMLEYVQENYPLTVTVEGNCGLNLLDNLEYPLNESFHSISELISQHLGAFESQHCWMPKAGYDMLSGVGVNGYSFRKKASEKSEDEPISQREVLTNIARRFCSRLIQWDGWRIDQPEAMLKFSDVVKYSSEGALINHVNAPSVIDVDFNDFLSGLLVQRTPALKTSSIDFVHETSLSARFYFPTTLNGQSFQDSVLYITSGEESITFAATMRLLREDIPSEYFDSFAPLKFDYWIKLGDTYWDNTSKKWSSSQVINVASDRVFKRSVSCFVSIPEVAEAKNNIELYISLPYIKEEQQPIVPLTKTKLDATFEVKNQNEKSRSSTIRTIARSNTGATDTYNHGSVIIGDGPNISSKSKLQYNDSTLEMITGWLTDTEETKESSDRRCVKTSIKFFNSSRFVLRGVLYVDYEPNMLLRLDGKIYLFNGGTLNGDNVWQATWIELTQEDSDFNYENQLKTNSNLVGATSGSILSDVLDITFRQNEQLKSEMLAYTSAALNSGVTIEIIYINEPDQDIVEALKAGFIFTLINLYSFETQRFELSEDYNSDLPNQLKITTSSLNYTFPKNSGVLLTGKDIPSYIIKTAQQVVAGVSSVEQVALCYLDSSISGTVNTLEVKDLNYPLTAGQKITIKKASDSTVSVEVTVLEDVEEFSSSIPIQTITIPSTIEFEVNDLITFNAAQSSGLLRLLVNQAMISASNAATYSDQSRSYRNQSQVYAEAADDSAEAAINAATESANSLSEAIVAVESAEGFALAAQQAKVQAEDAESEAIIAAQASGDSAEIALQAQVASEQAAGQAQDAAASISVTATNIGAYIGYVSQDINSLVKIFNVSGGLLVGSRYAMINPAEPETAHYFTILNRSGSGYAISPNISNTANWKVYLVNPTASIEAKVASGDVFATFKIELENNDNNIESLMELIADKINLKALKGLTLQAGEGVTISGGGVIDIDGVGQIRYNQDDNTLQIRSSSVISIQGSNRVIVGEGIILNGQEGSILIGTDEMPKIGFGRTPIQRPIIAGYTNQNPALESLIQGLDQLGLVIDNTQ